MADIQPDKVRSEVNRTKMVRLTSGTRVQIIIGGNVYFDATVPLGKVLVGAITLAGELENA